MNHLYRKVQYLELYKDETVCQYGDPGDLFYIILKGEVIVKTPSPDIIEGSQLSPIGFLIYVNQYFRDIQWNTLKHGSRIR